MHHQTQSLFFSNQFFFHSYKSPSSDCPCTMKPKFIIWLRCRNHRYKWYHPSLVCPHYHPISSPCPFSFFLVDTYIFPKEIFPTKIKRTFDQFPLPGSYDLSIPGIQFRLNLMSTVEIELHGQISLQTLPSESSLNTEDKWLQLYICMFFMHVCMCVCVFICVSAHVGGYKAMCGEAWG